MSAPARILLPPRPRRRDWWTAGACAGLLLGIAEIALLRAAGVEPPPRLALLVLGGDVLLVAVPAGVVGLAIVAGGARASHCQLVGGVLGLVLLAPVLGPILGGLGGRTGSAGLLALGAALAAGGLAIAAGLGAARLLGRLELHGVVASPLLTFAVAAAGTAGAEAALARGPRIAAGAALVVAAAAIGLLAAVLVGRARRRPGRRAPWSFGRAFVVLAALAAAVVYGPRWLPWLLVDATLPPVGDGPPNLLLIGLDADLAPDPVEAGDDRATPTLALLGANGLLYERVLGGRAGDVRALTELPPAGAALLEHHAALGYATGAVVLSPDREPPEGAGAVVSRAGPRTVLARHGRESAGGALLLGLPARALAGLGLDAALRTPEQVSGDAIRWLVGWRATRSSTPFALLVDYAGAAASPSRLDREVARLIDWVAQLELADRTLILVATAPADGAALRVYVRPPEGSRLADARLRLSRPIPAGEIALALALAAEAESPAEMLLLPGAVLP